jgi:hypothetical protein
VHPPATSTPSTDSTSTTATPLSAPVTVAAQPDPSALPQTTRLPSAADPTFQSRIQDLVRAVAGGNVAEAAPSFFPLSAYIQVKAISDPVHDYQTRLIVNFDQDIMALHSSAGATGGVPSVRSVQVPATAQWILPGVEYNKGSYWRVYGTTVTYELAGVVHSFSIASMISWRGQWYVVHLGSIR